MNTHYTTFQIISIFGSAAIGITSIVMLHMFKKHRIALLLLFVAAFFIRISIITYDNYLNIWDEQFHALVAKNMIDEPFRPMLYTDPVLPYSEAMWISSHVWLHKPPLFLWQMALSMKFFGVNEFALRLPSVMMSLLLVMMIYSLARRWLNRYIAFYAALMATFASYFLDSVSGWYATDHNDIAFIFYVTASLWAWSKYFDFEKKLRWSAIVGVAAGCAVLVKWMPGLLIYGTWGLTIILSPDMRKSFKSWIHSGFAFLISLMIFLPWQIYAFLSFPEEYRVTSLAKASHLWEVIEGHEGDWLYHFHIMDITYANGMIFVIIPAMILLFRRLRRKVHRIAALSFFLIPFIVYSVAATKMPAFTLISSAIVFMATGTLIYEVFLFTKPRYLRHRKYGKFIALAALTGCLFWFYNVDNIQQHHTYWKRENALYRQHRQHSVNVFRQLNSMDLPEKSVFINCKSFDAVMMMFYTPYVAYDGLQDEYKMNILLQSDRDIYVFKGPGTDDFSLQYPEVKVIDIGYYQ